MTTVFGNEALAAVLSAEVEARREPPWLYDIRRQAADAFAAVGWPKRTQERWRFFPVETAIATSWDSGTAAAADPGPELAAALNLNDAARIVMVDGHIAAIPEDIAGVQVQTLAEAMAERPEWLAAHLAQAARRYDLFPPAAIATARFTDVAIVHVTGTCVHPLLLEHHASGAAAAYPRLLVVADNDAQATLIEAYVGPEVDAYRITAVAEWILGARSRIEHVRMVLDGTGADHMLLGEVVHRGEGSSYTGIYVGFGGARTRLDINVRIDAEHVESTVKGTYLLGGTQVLDMHTRIEHLQPNSISHELVKGVLAGKARGVFHGRIYVDQAAQKTDAYQANPNLLLSNDAVANSNPELEIYADDVRCSHGATFGELDTDALFYMRTRGLSREQAQQMLVYAFASDVLMSIPHDGLREALTQRLQKRLMQLRSAGETL